MRIVAVYGRLPAQKGFAAALNPEEGEGDLQLNMNQFMPTQSSQRSPVNTRRFSPHGVGFLSTCLVHSTRIV